jgi:UDP-N-acetyl-D-glucosamine dehydrogenase
MTVELSNRFAAKNATVAVVGLGYVGLPTVRAFHDAGFIVVGYDIDDSKIKKLRSGQAYLKHLGSDWIAALAKSPRFKATSAPADLGAADAIILCVPTPLGEHREPDLSFVEKSTEMVAQTLRKNQLIILTSTSYPGTTRDVCKPILDRKGLVCGRDYFLAFSPEREDPGRPGVNTKSIPRLVGGIDEPSTALATALLSSAIEKVIPVDSAEVAESAKLLENIYRAVNIALVNELKPVLAAMDIDIWKVIAAAATKPFGYQPFYPGPGLGGHCIPIDPFYLTWRAREFGHVTRFIELAGEINSKMPHQVVEAVERALNDCDRPVKGAGILIIGLAYKPDIDDIRESPAAEIITLLGAMGARISYHDPHIARFPRMRKYQHDLASAPLTRESIAAADCVVIVTNHSVIDYALLGEHARLIVDTRNAMAKVASPKARVVHA